MFSAKLPLQLTCSNDNVLPAGHMLFVHVRKAWVYWRTSQRFERQAGEQIRRLASSPFIFWTGSYEKEGAYRSVK